MRLDRKRLLFVFTLALLVVVLLEASLDVAARLSRRVHGLLASPWVSYSIPDPKIGNRPNPDFPEHDAHGFRNARVPESADVVAMGDSQTYGTGVTAEQAWPAQTAAMTGKTVYNMSFGGYSPAHALFFWDEASALHPAVLIDAVYMGNDFFDCFDLVYNHGQLPELKSLDPAVQQRVRDAEKDAPIATHVNSLFAMDDVQDVVSGPGGRAIAGEATQEGWLARHSSLYGLLRRARYEWARRARDLREPGAGSWERAKVFAAAHPAFCQPFENGRVRTVFTTEYRLAAVDQDDPRIHEGLQVALGAFRRTHDLAAARKIRFIVLLIPTKESVFADVARGQPEDYRRLIENETRARRTMTEFFETHGMESLDVLPALREQLVTGPQPYGVTHDGHPNEHGHRAIARAVAAYLERPAQRTALPDDASPTGGKRVRTPCPGVRTGVYVPDCPCSAGAIGFENISTHYDRLGGVRATARNAGVATIHIDPIQAGIPVLFRWNPELQAWDEVETWRCANVGQGTKRSVSPSATLPLDIASAGGIVDFPEGARVEIFDGRNEPTRGRYRIGLRYSVQPWPTMADLPAPRPECFLQLSTPFEVEK